MLWNKLIGSKAESFNIRNSEITQQLATDSITVTAPAGVVNGDLLILHLAGHLNSTVTTPSGWTLIASNSTYGTATYYKTAASEPSSYTVTTGESRDWVAVVVAFVKGTLDQTNNANTTASTLSNSGVTVTNDGSLLLFIVTTSLSGVTFPTPTGMIALDSENANRPSAAVFYEFVDSGATGTISTTPSSEQFSTTFLCSVY